MNSSITLHKENSGKQSTVLFASQLFSFFLFIIRLLLYYFSIYDFSSSNRPLLQMALEQVWQA